MQLASPPDLEAFSALTGEPVLVVDLDSEAGRAGTVAAARASLRQLPCPSVALLRGSPRTGVPADLVESFDVVVPSREALAPVAETVQRRPQAALALVQLLRQSLELDLHQGLIAESLAYSTLQGGPEFSRWLAGRPAPRPRRASPEPPVLTERTGDCLQLTLNRPEKHNAFSAEMRDALAEGLQVAVRDPSIRSIVLRGAGASFCSGGDLDEFGTLPDPATAHVIRSTRNVGRLLAACSKRLRFELHGACVGAGTELPAFAASVAAREDTCFQLPEVGMGLVPGAGGTVSLPRRIGRQRTALLALSGQRLDAHTARRWGLVDEITP